MGDPLRLYGLKALVTNAGGGVGEAVARTLIKHGATVLAVDGINSGVEQHFDSVKGVDGIATTFTDVGQLPALVETAAKKLGGIDILVNDFPLQGEEPIASNGEALNKLIERRVDLLLAMSRAALPHLKKSPAGRIINLGFLRSIFAAKGDEACDTAERNLADVTRAMAIEAGEFGITANYVQPGAVMTPASREVFRKNTDLRDHCIGRSAARRLGEPVDIAKVVLFLASDDAVFVSGTGIVVDGGRTDV
jgi:NAD(P)-dependent dehydrogenase (short-subunit alcohol dehydrogenase family)